ncbi:MAG: bifunctional hydroxymethylpyrimidine kinase/phosphomethylpyrimidine kinase [Gammaproteobacteria bacterium]|nr:bifunctional hydroxymethylpyrimidine kinase/phosphomethylpyrimidine kinase [Gammaproteobacteria bacterium]
MKNKIIPTILTIAGSDSSAGAGIQADLKTIHALGGYALTAITAITAQNRLGVHAVHAVDPTILSDQLNALLGDYQIDAIKIGMIPNSQLMHIVIAHLKQHPNIPVFIDTVMISSSGQTLMDRKALEIFITELLPLGTLITPNIPELNTLLEISQKNSILGTDTEIKALYPRLKRLNIKATLIKGGHSIDKLAIDYLLTDHARIKISSQRLNIQNTHGTGCTLSSAIALEYAKTACLLTAVSNAKAFLFQALQHAHTHQPTGKKAQNITLLKGGLNHLNRR